jgi:methionyl-tRNA formyltransferase
VRIGYFADGPWSHLALDKIIADTAFEVVFIIPRYDSQDPILKEKAKKLNIDFLPIKNVNSEESIKSLEKYKASIYVSMSFDQILKSRILSKPPLGFINCHAGALPFYRGRNILNWVLINDEKEFGVSVHYVDEGIDTGDIIIQKKSKINDSDNYASILKRATKLCSDSLYLSLKEIHAGKAKRVKQSSIHPVGSYFSKRKIGDEFIDWNWNSRRIFNFVRAISDPGPSAQTFHNESILKINKAEFIKDAPIYIANSGEVIGKGEDFLVIKTGDSSIKILTKDKSSKENEKKLNKLCIGDRLSSK